MENDISESLHPSKCANKLEAKPIILFDGVCNLCNWSVQYILKRDKKKKFLFATLQGKTGQELLRKHHLPTNDFNSFILAEGDRISTRSTAVLRMLKILGRRWKLFYGFIILPRFFRNWIYSMIAKNRYKWYGKRQECMVPTAEIRERFLE